MLMEASQERARHSDFAQVALSFEDLSELLGLIYQGPMEPVPWGRALEQVRRHLRAEYVTLILRSPGSDKLGLMVHASDRGIVHEAEGSYNSYYYALDPFVGLPSDRVVTIDERLGSRAWCNSELYQQFLKPSDLRYILGADIRTDDGVQCRFRVCRNHESSDFSETDKAFCGVLLPHLQRAVSLHSRMDMVESERAVYASAMDRMLVGMAILDETGAVIKTNTAADQILAAKDSICMVRGRLDVNNPLENRKFQLLLRRAVQGHFGATQAVTEAMSITRNSSSGRLGVLFRSISLSEWAEDNKRRPACVVFIRDPERKSQAPQEVVRKLFDFTPAETELALQLTNGLALDEAAEELGISKNTARAHLRAIFVKTGVTRQAELVRTLLSSVVSLG